jgi:hypothetical protein
MHSITATDVANASTVLDLLMKDAHGQRLVGFLMERSSLENAVDQRAYGAGRTNGAGEEALFGAVILRVVWIGCQCRAMIMVSTVRGQRL